MKNIFNKIIIFSALALVLSCSQDPIFFTISTEPIPVKPRIQGGPTNMAVFEREYPDPDNDNSTKKVSIMYVASGDLHWYAKAGTGAGNPGWDSSEYYIPQPGGKVIGLAATGDHLYALCIIGSGVTTVLRRIGPALDDAWRNVPIGPGVRYRLIQTIFTDKNRLFAGAMNNSGSDFGILYLAADNTDPSNPVSVLRQIISDTEMLTGAASLGNSHFLSTRGKGVYKVTKDDLDGGSVKSDVSPQLPELIRRKDDDGNDFMDDAGGNPNRMLMGMIQLNDNGPIIVIERSGGTFFEVREEGFTRIRYSSGGSVASGRFATGALAVWRQVIRNDDGSPNYTDGRKMLIAGIQGGLFSTTTSSSFSHGYIEIELDSPLDFNEGWLVFNTINRSVSPNITVDGNTDRYTATIGKHPINHMYQASSDVDANMTFFASTQTAGLWSYRNRTGGLQWNAEN